MAEMRERLAADPELAARYQAAHDDYLARRDKAAAEDGLEPLPRGTQTAGGMPDRVKCLHALVGHELAAPGTNPFGREALDARGGPEAPASAGPIRRSCLLSVTAATTAAPAHGIVPAILGLRMLAGLIARC